MHGIAYKKSERLRSIKGSSKVINCQPYEPKTKQKKNAEY